jgi:putative ABC transport system substrate-binding protein
MLPIKGGIEIMNSARFGSVLLLGLLVTFAPSRSGAQQSAKPFRLGWLGVASTQILKLYAPVYRETLRTLGYEEGRNYTIEYRFSDGDNTKLPALARELAANHPDLIVASSEPALVAVIDNGGGVPVVVFACDALPKLLGSIRRPGGNATGFSCVSADLVGKRMGLLKELVPGLSRVALLYSTDTEESEIFEAERVAKILDVAVTRFAIHNPARSMRL